MIQAAFYCVLAMVQFAVPSYTGAPASSSGPCSLPFTDTFAGSGALGACWTQSTGGGLVSLVRSSGTATAASAGTAVAFETGSGTATTQSIQTVYSFAGSNHAALIVRSNLANNTNYTWSPSDTNVYAIVAGSATVIAHPPLPSSGNTLKFSVTGTSVTWLNVTTGATGTITNSAVSAAGYAGLQSETGTNAQSFGSTVVN